MGRRHRPVARAGLALAVLATLLASGCVSLAPAFVPANVLDQGTGNGWAPNAEANRDVSGGLFSKSAVRAYEDDASDGRGYHGVLQVVSLRGLLSPDREDLRERVRDALRQEAEDQGLVLSGDEQEGQRTLANGATSLYVVVDARARSQGSVFASDSTVKVLGEVFRCTGGATVVVTGSAQIDRQQSVGGIPTSTRRDATTWAEIVADPSGSIEGRTGSRGLVHNVQCG